MMKPIRRLCLTLRERLNQVLQRHDCQKRRPLQRMLRQPAFGNLLRIESEVKVLARFTV